MPRIPVATYRLQLNHTFTFRDATKVIPYLHALGIGGRVEQAAEIAEVGADVGVDEIVLELVAHLVVADHLHRRCVARDIAADAVVEVREVATAVHA